MEIKAIHARQILDSRGNPTVETEVLLENGAAARASVPSGASTGALEALELRDGDKTRYGGKGVLKAVWNVNEKIADILTGNVADVVTVDNLMRELDNTENKSNLGANAMLSVSLAIAKAAAKSHHLPLWQYFHELAQEIGREESGTSALQTNPRGDKWTAEDLKSATKPSLPLPMMNVMNGGAHANWSTDFQEYMIIPYSAGSMAEAVRMGSEIFHALKQILAEKGYATTVGDEGGFAPQLGGDNNEPLELISAAVERAGYALQKDVKFAMDVAASEFFVSGEKMAPDLDSLGHYELKTNGDWKSANDMMNWYDWIIKNYPVASIEDGLSETDWQNWRTLTERFGKEIQLVGDDLFVTNTKLLARGISAGVANAILIKPNQIGTISETIAAVLLAKRAGYRTVISHRSGETEDTTIAHLAVGLGAGQIKTGSMSRGERIAKYNELMRIEEANPEMKLAKPF